MDENNRKIQNWMKEFQIEKVDLELIKDALTHSSYKGMGFNVKDNERLEFLGDSVLDLLTAHQLFLNSQLSEGLMTEERKEYVNNEKLAQIFDNVGLDGLIRTANDFNLSSKNKADFIEAIFGAIFLKKGYQRCVEFWDILQERTGNKNKNDSFQKRIEQFSEYKVDIVDLENDENTDLEHTEDYESLFDDFDFFSPASRDKLIRNLDSATNQYKNAKNVLQEYCQKRGLPIPEYKLVERMGLDHRPLFTIELSASVIIDGKVENKTTIGKAGQKKKAEFDAAEKMCDLLGLKYRPM